MMPARASPVAGMAALWTGLNDLLFPSSTLCPLCQQTERGPERRGRICAACWLALAQPRAACPRCGRPSSEGEATSAAVPVAPVCADCRRQPPPFDAACPAAPYAGRLREAIGRFKYRGERALAAPLGHLVARRLDGLLRRWTPRDARGAGPPVLVPVPLHATRLRERGYNQAEDLSRAVGRLLGLRVESAALRRTRATPPQTALSRAQRAVNLRGAFEPGRAWEGGAAVLVDDVTTTSSTLREAAWALRAAGAPAVLVAAVAATPPAQEAGGVGS